MPDTHTQLPAGVEAQAPLSLAPGAAETAQSPYRVLARKYRPKNFDELIGQEAMVKTLSNAFDLNRIHQAYILTGVRGVGKTTTARILARAFNYELPADGAEPAVTKPTIHMPKLGVHCQAIMESRHVDVIEMDAASHTGIDDVREIIESARYKPVMARTKVYIIDEVHMLSRQAFNGLLKTLEEPPDHVKFIFATTEIEKVPVTVRSRCQRFDLRRIDPAVLTNYLASICAQEGVAAEEAALVLIARAAEGSVRDALSLLDQAIAHGMEASGAISAEAVRAMLGLADHARIIDLFEALMRGHMAQALDALKELYDFGAEPAEILAALAEFVHLVTRIKLVAQAAQDAALTPQEKARGTEYAQALTIPVLTRSWQLLLKGIREVKESPRPLPTAEMVLVRIGFAADLPTPGEVLRKLAAVSGEGPGSLPVTGQGSNGHGPGAAAFLSRPAAAAPKEAGPRATLASFEDLVALAGHNRDIQMKLALERDVRLIHFEPGRIEFALAPGAPPQLAQTLMVKLLDWTGSRWAVVVSSAPGAQSLKEQEEAKARALLQGVRAEPLVRRALEVFPGAEIVAIRAYDEGRTAMVGPADGEAANESGTGEDEA